MTVVITMSHSGGCGVGRARVRPRKTQMLNHRQSWLWQRHRLPGITIIHAAGNMKIFIAHLRQMDDLNLLNGGQAAPFLFSLLLS